MDWLLAVESIPAMNHMLPRWMTDTLAVSALIHFIGYESFGQACAWSVSRKRLRLAPVIVQLGFYVRWCGRTHLLMFVTLFVGGYTWFIYTLVEIVSAITTGVTVYALLRAAREILSVLEINVSRSH